jgi:hexosaminidase
MPVPGKMLLPFGSGGSIPQTIPYNMGMLNILPLPAELEQRPGEFRLSNETTIQPDAANLWNANFLHDLLTPSSGYPLRIETGEAGKAGNGISLHLEAGLSVLGDEGYRLEIRTDGVELAAATPCGVFHAIQTLRQMLPMEVEARSHTAGVDWKLPCGVIRDRPRFKWRGFMLDEGRHFQGRESVLLTLDLMALQKLNVFHWHLTEDQGWRIEIRKYPRLTEVGARRNGTSQGFGRKENNGIPHSGSYTQEEIREIVAYAAERHILVVPEIEIPGHSLAALAAYPELSCTGGPFEVATSFGIFPDIYCAGKEATFTFLQAVLDELLDLFPSPFIHIGGDEAPKTRWKNCPDCQRRMRAEGLKDEHALQGYVTNRMAAYLESKGRRVMGWNQILEPGLAPSAVVQYWLGNRKELVEAIRGGREVVMSTYLDTYLDHAYSLMPLRRAYRYEPALPGLDERATANVLGLEFPLWTEWVPNRARLDYQTYPRLTAMAETGWTPKGKKDYGSFRKRLVPFLRRLERLGVQHASLREAEPGVLKRAFGAFSIAQPQRKVAG